MDRVLVHLAKIKRAPKTIDLARRALKSIELILKPQWPDDVTPMKADEWVQALTNNKGSMDGPHKKSFKASGVSSYLRSASACFSRFVRWGIVNANPFLSCDKPKVERNLPNPFQPDDLKTIISNSTPLFARTIKILVESGMRPDELFHLKWKNVMLGDMPAIQIKREGDWNPKMNHERIIPASKALVDILGNPGDPEGLVIGLTSKQKILSMDWLKKSFKRVIKKAGLVDKHYTPYCCRDTYATSLALQGYQAHDIAARLGHGNLATSMSYVSLARILQDARSMNANDK